MDFVNKSGYDNVAGPDTRQNSDWAALRLPLLKHAFELQANGLDNCAAACCCKIWRLAVNSSCIPVLHLHAGPFSSANHWSAFLRSRNAIGHLKLTGTLDAADSCNKAASASSSTVSSPLRSIPVTCHSLSATELFAKEIYEYTDQAAQLTHLVRPAANIQCIEQPPCAHSPHSAERVAPQRSRL